MEAEEKKKVEARDGRSEKAGEPKETQKDDETTLNKTADASSLSAKDPAGATTL